jgi:hypothetical protein
MVQANSAAVYIHYGVKAYNKGNVEAGNSDMKQALQSLTLVVEHADRAGNLLKTYNSKN